MYATFERFEIKITKAQALQGSHSGQCDSDIQELLTVPAIRRQLSKIGPIKIEAELQGYGAWDEDELQDAQQNKARILWIACSDITEDLRLRKTNQK